MNGKLDTYSLISCPSFTISVDSKSKSIFSIFILCRGGKLSLNSKLMLSISSLDVYLLK
ncbi:hypothetical protein RYX36_003055 [Vicia faba]